jgi:hypothetical protein
VDFYLPDTRQLIQVSHNLAQPVTRQREIRALTDAMPALNLTQGLILSDTNEPPIEHNGLTINVRSTVEWLIQQEIATRERRKNLFSLDSKREFPYSCPVAIRYWN